MTSFGNKQLDSNYFRLLYSFTLDTPFTAAIHIGVVTSLKKCFHKLIALLSDGDGVSLGQTMCATKVSEEQGEEQELSN